MGHRDLLVILFGRYPSAISTPHGEYRLICPSCGDTVSVMAPTDEASQIDVVCASCGYEDHLVEETKAPGVANAA